MVKKRGKRTIAAASSAHALAFVTTLQRDFRRRKPSPKERERLREYLAKFSPAYLRSIARRLIIDIVKGPHDIVKGPRPSRTTRTGSTRTAATAARARRQPRKR